MTSNSKCSKYLMQEAEPDGWPTRPGHGKAQSTQKAETCKRDIQYSEHTGCAVRNLEASIVTRGQSAIRCPA